MRVRMSSIEIVLIFWALHVYMSLMDHVDAETLHFIAHLQVTSPVIDFDI